MSTDDNRLPSWRPGATRDAVIAFLDAAVEVPVADRLACFDNDGTLWCERPGFAQLDFFVDVLRQRVHDDAAVAEVPEFAAVLTGDPAAVGAVGLERTAGALASVFDGFSPDAFAASVREFMDRATHPTLGIPLRATVYQPMLELLDALRRIDFTIGVVTGGGTEFVRAVSQDLYKVPPATVVGTMIGYEFARADDERPTLRRTTSIAGGANEGAAKVVNIQTQLGQRPILVGGNSGGDREMMEWACSGEGLGMAILIDHDDAEREFAYVSKAQTFVEDDQITDVGRRLGWTIVSIADDWEVVFPA